MKRLIIYILIVSTLMLLIGCSPSVNEEFNDNDIKISMLSSKIRDEDQTYIFEVINEGYIELSHLSLELYYPVLIANGTKSNPFTLQGRAESNFKINLKKGEKVSFSFYAPVKEVFGDSSLLDFNKPQLKIKGFAIVNKSEVPFEKSGDILSE